METLRNLFISLGLDWEASGFAQAQVAVHGLEKAARLLFEAIKAIPEAMGEAIKHTADYGGKLDDASKKSGIATDTLQELGFVAAQSGVGTDELQSSLGNLAKNMFEASKGSKSAVEAFAAIGTKVTEEDGTLRDVDEVFADLADRFVAIENPAKRTALAMEVFGKSGASLIPTLLEGKEGIQKLRADMVAFGLVMSKEAVAAADKFGDSMDLLHSIWDSLRRDFGSAAIEALQPFVDVTLEWIKANRLLLRSKTQAFVKGLTTGVRALAKAAMWLVDNWKLLAVIATSILIPVLIGMKALLLEQLVAFGLNTIAAIAFGAASMAAGLSAAAAWALANAPLILMGVLIAALLIAAEDVLVFLEGGESLIGRIGPAWTKFLDQWTSFDAGDSFILKGLKQVISWLTDIEGRLLPAIKNGWLSNILQPISATIELIFKLFRGTANFADYLKTIPGLGLAIEAVQKLTPEKEESLLSSRPPQLGLGGGAASPAASVLAQNQAQIRPPLIAPSFSGNFVVNAQPGQSAQEVAGATREVMEDWWDGKMRSSMGF